MPHKINLAVIFGSQSGEHEVSLSSARAVIQALDKDKYEIIPIAITKKGNWLFGDKGEEYLKMFANQAGKEAAVNVADSQKLVTIRDEDRGLTNFSEGSLSTVKIDLVLPILHGNYGEDGRLQGMLDMFGIPYVFSGVLAHALAMNKPKAKVIAQAAGVPVPADIEIKKGAYNYALIKDQLTFPVMVKPAELGSSVGIAIAKNEAELEAAVAQAFKFGASVLVEAYIKGRELTVTVMEQGGVAQALSPIEIIPLISEFYDYKAKYEAGGSRHVCPAELPPAICAKVQNYAVQVFQAIGCRDLARADFIWDQHDELYFIDINTIPGMTATSLAPEAARAQGYEFSDFLDKLIENALGRK